MLTLGGPGPCSQFRQRPHFPFLWKYHSTKGTGEQCPSGRLLWQEEDSGILVPCDISRWVCPEICTWPGFACSPLPQEGYVHRPQGKNVSWQLSCFVIWPRLHRTVLSSFNLSWRSMDHLAEGGVWPIEGNHEWAVAPWCWLDPRGRECVNSSLTAPSGDLLLGWVCFISLLDDTFLLPQTPVSSFHTL